MESNEERDALMAKLEGLETRLNTQLGTFDDAIQGLASKRAEIEGNILTVCQKMIDFAENVRDRLMGDLAKAITDNREAAKSSKSYLSDLLTDLVGLQEIGHTLSSDELSKKMTELRSKIVAEGDFAGPEIGLKLKTPFEDFLREFETMFTVGQLTKSDMIHIRAKPNTENSLDIIMTFDGQNFPKELFEDLEVSVSSSTGLLYQPTTLDFLIWKGEARTFRNKVEAKISFEVSTDFDILLHVKLFGSDVKGSPMSVSMFKNEKTINRIENFENEGDAYKKLLSANSTLVFGKIPFPDPDEQVRFTSRSDRSDSYDDDEILKTGSKTLVERAQARLSRPHEESFLSFAQFSGSRNVSFNPEASILQLQNSEDLGNGQDIRTEPTNFNESRSKSKISNFWNDDSKVDSTLDRRPNDTRSSFGNSLVSPPTWDDTNYSVLQEEYESRGKFDLAQENVGLTHCKELTFDENSEILMLETVTRNPYFDETYVTDILHGRIHIFKGWKYEGVWWTSGISFQHPRYVMAVPCLDPLEEKESGRDVFVLDDLGLHWLTSAGVLRGSFFQKEAKNFRGLAYNNDYFWLITSEKIAGKGYDLIFIATQQPTHLELMESATEKDVDMWERMRIPLNSCITDVERSKCRFIAYNKMKIYTSDMELGCFYVTSCKDLTSTRVVLPDDSQSICSGIEICPKGNILVAAAPPEGHANLRLKVHLYSKDNQYIRCIIDGSDDIQSILGMTFDGRSLYACDYRKRAVHIFNVVEKSPKKKPSKSQIFVPVDI